MAVVDISRASELVDVEVEASKGKGLVGFRYWKPKPGDNRVRIFPPWTDKGVNRNLWFRKVVQHFDVGEGDDKRMFTCPAHTPTDEEKRRCPVCAVGAILKKSKDAVDRQLADDWYKKKRFFSAIVDMDDQVYTQQDYQEWLKKAEQGSECPFKVGDLKVQLWGYGVNMLRDINNQFQGGSVDITDPSKGHNLLIKRYGTDRDDTKYSVSVEIKPTPLPLPAHQKLEDVQPNLDNLMPFSPEDEMLTAIGGDIAGLLGPGWGGKELGPTEERRQLSDGGGRGGRQDAREDDVWPPKSEEAPQAASSRQQEPPHPAEEEKPPCYEDPAVFNLQDAECVGGAKNGSNYSRCPFLDGCQKAVQAKTNPQPSRRRSAGGPDASAAQLEAEMRDALAGRR